MHKKNAYNIFRACEKKYNLLGVHIFGQIQDRVSCKIAALKLIQL